MNELFKNVALDVVQSMSDATTSQIWVYVVAESRFYVLHEGKLIETPCRMPDMEGRVVANERMTFASELAQMARGEVPALTRYHRMRWDEDSEPVATRVDMRTCCDAQGQPQHITLVMTLDVMPGVNLSAHAEKHILGQVLNDMPSMVRILDVTNEWRVFMANKSFADLVGETPESIIGKNHYDFFGADMAARWESVLNESMDYSAAHPHVHDGRVDLPDGRMVYLQTTRFTYWIENRQYLFASSEDVTNLMNARLKAEENERLKDVFYANMSHDIRTPLNAIAGFSELLAETDDPKEREEYVEIIKKSNMQVMALFNDILDYSRIKSGMTESCPTTFELRDFLDDIYRSYIPEFAKLPIQLRLEVPSSDLLVNLDKKHLTQVVTNYVNNAIKYTTSGSVTMGYSVDDEALCLYVDDTGVGIPEEGCALVFNRFEKLNSYIQGTGLGLSICKAVVEAMGGSVGVDSEVGKGSHFWARLPKSCIVGTEQ